MDYIVGKNPCPKCRDKGGDNSGDNLHWYGDGMGGHCFSCGYTIPSDEWKEENNEDIYYYEQDKGVTMGLSFTMDKIKEEYVQLINSPYRGIKPEIYKHFGVFHKVNDDGELTEQIYPTFVGKKIQGFKRRELPKKFLTPYGKVGADVDFFGQFRFLESTSNTVLIMAGEIDMLSAYQMMSERTDSTNKSKGSDYGYTPVISSTIGEVGTYVQARNQYDWLMKFNRIVVCMDNDAAGHEAIEELFSAIPKGKMFVMDLGDNDANEMLVAGRQREFINAFFKAKPYTPAGVHASTSLYDAVIDFDLGGRLTFPPFLDRLQKMYGGGWIKREIGVIFAPTSVGKTSFMNEITTHWVINHPEEVVGVLSLEATVDKYAMSLISSYLGARLLDISSKEEREKYMQQKEVKEKIDKLLFNKDGAPSFFVCDDRGADIEVVKEKIQEMIIKMGITILIIDPFSDLQAGMSISEQEVFSSWLKKVTKEYQLTLVLVCHTRKVEQRKKKNKDGESWTSSLTEDDIIGSSTIMKSSGQTFSLERDKLADTEEERNTTHVVIHKSRYGGDTGHSGDIYYDSSTNTLHDKIRWMKENGGGATY